MAGAARSDSLVRRAPARRTEVAVGGSRADRGASTPSRREGLASGELVPCCTAFLRRPTSGASSCRYSPPGYAVARPTSAATRGRTPGERRRVPDRRARVTRLGFADAPLGADRFHPSGTIWGGAVAARCRQQYPPIVSTLTGSTPRPHGASRIDRRGEQREKRRTCSRSATDAEAFVPGQRRRDVARPLRSERSGRRRRGEYSGASSPVCAHRRPQLVPPTTPPTSGRSPPTMYVWSTNDVAPARSGGSDRRVSTVRTGSRIDGVSHWLPRSRRSAQHAVAAHLRDLNNEGT